MYIYICIYDNMEKAKPQKINLVNSWDAPQAQACPGSPCQGHE